MGQALAIAAPFISGASGIFQGFAANEAAQGQAALQQAQGDIARIEGDINAQLLTSAARDTTRVAASQARIRQGRAARAVGSQRAGAAAQGIDLSSQVVQQATAESTLIGELDAVAIMNNARRRSFGLQMAAETSRFQGRAAQTQAGALASLTRQRGSAAVGRGLMGATAGIFSSLARMPSMSTMSIPALESQGTPRAPGPDMTLDQALGVMGPGVPGGHAGPLDHPPPLSSNARDFVDFTPNDLDPFMKGSRSIIDPETGQLLFDDRMTLSDEDLASPFGMLIRRSRR